MSDTTPLLTYPEDHWCPRCQVHLRSQDSYTGPHILLPLLPLCPVCADDDRRAAKQAQNPSAATEGEAVAVEDQTPGVDAAPTAGPAVMRPHASTPGLPRLLLDGALNLFALARMAVTR